MNALKNKTVRAAAFVAGALVVLAGTYIAFTPKPVAAQDATYGPKVYKDHGGDQENVASGGSIVVASGGTLDASAGTVLPPTLASLTVSGAATLGSAAVTGAASLGSASVAGAFKPGSKTKAQLLAYAGTAGEEWYCSDCSTDGVVITIGTSAGSVARISARTTAIN